MRYTYPGETVPHHAVVHANALTWAANADKARTLANDSSGKVRALCLE